ncbi:MAG: hypothetical protein HC889_01815 [Synechococcaceae cyanobacterium SM1_2_3]|nr:hypothetical protein [Synechococcaceae cyanobacterium SM1_2_3]
MRIDLSLRRWLWLQNLLFTLLLVAVIGLLAWLSLRYTAQADWSANRRNTLSSASQTLLTHLDGPIRVTAYARDNPALRDAIARLIGRYQRYKIRFIPELRQSRFIARPGARTRHHAGR